MEQTGYFESSLLNYIEDIDFPRSRQELIDYCRDVEARHNVIDFLEHMPDRRYESLEDFLSAAGETIDRSP